MFCWDLVSRIGYVSNTDTHPIRRRYVSSEYLTFSYFRKYWIRELIRICLADTPSPTRLPRRPESHARASCRIPVPRSVTRRIAARRPPATGDEPPPGRTSQPAAGLDASLRPRTRECRRGADAARTPQSRTDASRPGARRHEHHRPMCRCVPALASADDTARTTPPAWLPTRPRGRDNLLQFPVVIQQQPG